MKELRPNNISDQDLLDVLQGDRSPALEAHMCDALRILQAAVDLGSDLSKAAFWFRNTPILDFDRRTAEQLVSQGEAEAVLSCLKILETGPRAERIVGSADRPNSVRGAPPSIAALKLCALELS